MEFARCDDEAEASFDLAELNLFHFVVYAAHLNTTRFPLLFWRDLEELAEESIAEWQGNYDRVKQITDATGIQMPDWASPPPRQ